MTSLASILLLLGLAPFGLAQIEREPNDRPADATLLARTRTGQPEFLVGRAADGVVERGHLDPGDVDYYAFAARAGDVLTVSLFESGRGAFADPVLAVMGPGDVEPVAIDDDAGPGFLPRLALPIDRTGVWTLAVTGFGDAEFDGGEHEERFAYDLVVAVAPDAVARRERNLRGGHGSAERAEPVAVPPERAVVVTGDLVPGEVDRFRVALSSQRLLTASLYDDAAGEFNDSRLELLDSRGRPFAQDDDSGPGFLSSLAAEGGQQGAAVVAVSGFDPHPEDALGHPERFRYRLVLSLRRK